MRVCNSTAYSSVVVYVWAVGHYVKFSKGPDDFSKIIQEFYKGGYNKKYIISEIEKLWETHFKGDDVWDFITVCPTHKKETINYNMINLAKTLSDFSGVPYEQLLVRRKTIKKNHELETFQDRCNNVRESIGVCGNVSGKKILVLDNVSTTGITLIDVKKTLLDGGAKDVVAICLGLSDEEEATDYDVNRIMKASKMMAAVKTKKISKDKIKRWKESEGG